jgi:hypothetical protein
MLAAAIVASSIIRLSVPSPAAQLADVERAAPFHVLVLTSSAQLMRAECVHDAAGASDVRLEYSSAETVIDVEERLPVPSDRPNATDLQAQLFDLDGYPASYRESGDAYRPSSSLIWFRPDLTVIVTSRDVYDAPMLVDIALELS